MAIFAKIFCRYLWNGDRGQTRIEPKPKAPLWGEINTGSQNVLLDLGKRGIIIRRVIAHSSMPDGIRLMRHIGFTETPPKAPGLRDFMIDVESSGIPFIRGTRKPSRWQGDKIIEVQQLKRRLKPLHKPIEHQIQSDSIAANQTAKKPW